MPFRIRNAQFVPKSASDIKKSIFHLTVNTNYRPADKDDAQEVGELLERATHEIFQEGTQEDFLLLLDGKDMDAILDTDVEYGVELGHGKQGGAMHMHIIITVEHKSKIRINMDHVREQYKEMLAEDPRIKNPHFDVHATHDHEKSIREYVEKEQ